MIAALATLCLLVAIAVSTSVTAVSGPEGPAGDQLPATARNEPGIGVPPRH